MHGVWTLEKTVRGRGRYGKCNLGNESTRQTWGPVLNDTDLRAESLGNAIMQLETRDECSVRKVYIISRRPAFGFWGFSFLFLLLD